jgi:hypothetical protein
MSFFTLFSMVFFRQKYTFGPYILKVFLFWSLYFKKFQLSPCVFKPLSIKSLTSSPLKICLHGKQKLLRWLIVSFKYNKKIFNKTTSAATRLFFFFFLFSFPFSFFFFSFLSPLFFFLTDFSPQFLFSKSLSSLHH